MKKLAFSVILFSGLASLAAAQMSGGYYYNNTPTAITSTSGGSAAGLGTASPGIIRVYPPAENNDIVQFDNLTIQSISSLSAPSEIVAAYTVYPMTGGANGTMTPSSPQMLCKRFNNIESGESASIPCPVPSAPATSASATAQVYPYPGGYSYRIEVDGSTRLMLRDRTPAALADFTSGNQINVFGFYNNDGTIQALIVRNMSKPAEKQFVQINNAQVVSISQNSLTVIQQPFYPCYGFGASGTEKQANYPCPLGAQIQNSTGLSVPQSLMPQWIALRKYVVNIDSTTIILNRIRQMISLNDIRLGDKVNVYGETDDTGAAIQADIVRDLSQPPTAQNLEGRVTQVNADGSFVIQAADGSIYTVQGAIQVGATIRISGMIDELNKVISQVTDLTVRNGGETTPPLPMPYLRIQGSTTVPSSGGSPRPTQ